ncbi:hypothetical protein [Pseudoalteromonas luteoviolacea]|uniref:Uncharacterized protein n=1 Tax=Pseudoalteromonas luteoviolacea NCIMB 1942 TaxID=1365253 RepID=A0A166Z8D3_9GAMM|nr:hypothetical protein [Pseudoalteromonas luteoviolacea]KZN44046.1 hypothetical protein N482_18135 [Pseudoalteromonas luteoviolacea NCIMB 1942]
MKLNKKNLKTLSKSSLESVYGGLTSTGAEPTLQANKQAIILENKKP